MTPPDTYTVEVAREIAERFTDWTRIADVGADWFKVILREDGVAEVLLTIGDSPPAAS